MNVGSHFWRVDRTLGGSLFIDVRVCRTGEHDDLVQEMRVAANALLVDDGRGGSFHPLGSGWTGGHINGSEQEHRRLISPNGKSDNECGRLALHRLFLVMDKRVGITLHFFFH